MIASAHIQTNRRSKIEYADVLVTGADPTGLTTAIELARRNIKVRIIERRSEPSTCSTALVAHAQTLEFMDILGVADEMIRQGYTPPDDGFSADAENSLRDNIYSLDARFPSTLVLSQAKTEAILEQRLNEFGVEVERNCELKHFQITEAAVHSTIISGDCTTKIVASRYLVDTDEGKSQVRKTLNIPFEGNAYDWTAFLGDVQLHRHRVEGSIEQHLNDRGLAFIVPLNDDSHRIVTIDRKYQNGAKQNELSLDDLQESISSILEKQVELSEPTWLTCWGASLPVASRCLAAQVCVGGDAAHPHSPAGSQGLNTGIQDAFNLGWKLAFVIQGNAREVLLDTYRSLLTLEEENLKRRNFIRTLLLPAPFHNEFLELLSVL